ncbi:MAG: hypothetical protein JXB00_00265, partial [Bacteroidales bacterium]|nr:hypothetical protein [Bacteroidales bacterium]
RCLLHEIACLDEPVRQASLSSLSLNMTKDALLDTIVKSIVILNEVKNLFHDRRNLIKMRTKFFSHSNIYFCFLQIQGQKLQLKDFPMSHDKMDKEPLYNARQANWNAFNHHMLTLQPLQQNQYKLNYSTWRGMCAIPQFNSTFDPDDSRSNKKIYNGTAVRS